MNKEELYNRLRTVAVDSMPSSIQHTLDEFFLQNVVIPKGSQLQEFADGRWLDLCYISENCEYRIKPKEPVYECQWLLVRDGVAEVTEGFYSYEDDIDYLSEKGWKRIEETKRERK